MTILEKKGDLKGLTLAFVGDGNNVANSLMFGGAKTGVSVRVVCPKGFEPKEDMVAAAREDGKAMGATMSVTNDLDEGLAGADVVYTDVWASMGQEAEAEARKAAFRPFQVNAALMAKAKEDALFLHCLPAHRGDEVTDEVIDSWRSVVFDEAENRLHAQKAVIYELLVGEEMI
jgi:ornithine carbamoyltransferase